MAPPDPTTPFRFVGRGRELQQLATLAGHALTASPRLAIVSGEPGIGKTSLVRVVDERARQRGFAVVWARAWELGGAPPYWLWSQVLEGLHTLAPACPEELRAVQDALDHSDSLDESRQFRVQARIVAAVRSVARDRPVLLALDDLHALDIESLRTLLLLVRSLQDERLLVVATARSVDTHTTPEHDALLSHLYRHAELVPIRGLDVRELEELVASSVDAVRSSAVAERLHTRTGGNPFFVRELLAASALADEQAPRDLRATLEARLDQLDAQATRILGAVAVLGMHTAAERVRKVSDASAERVEAALELAEAAGILRRASAGSVQFVHSLFAEVLVARLPASVRADMHERAGELLVTEGETPHLADIARHFVAVSQVRSEPRARQYLLRAAQGAERVAAYASAADLYALAGGDDVALAHGHSALLAGRRAQAREIYAGAFAAARAARDAEQTALAAMGFARTTEYLDFDDEAVQKLELAAAQQLPDVALRSRVLGALSVALWVSNARGRLDALSSEAVQLARQSGSPRCLAEALIARSHVLWSPRKLDTRRELVRELEHVTRELDDAGVRFEACRWWMNVCWEGGDGQGGDAAVEAYAAAAHRLGSAQAAMNVALRHATRAQIRGEFSDAERFIQTLRREGARADDPQTHLYATYGLLYPYLNAGRLDDVRALLPGIMEGTEVWRIMQAPAIMPAVGYLALGQVEDAVKWADSLDDVRYYIEWGETHRLGILADIAIALGSPARAEDVAARLAPFESQYLWSGIGCPGGPAALVLARLDRMLARAESARARLDIARSVAASMSDAPRLAEVERLLGEAPAKSVAVPRATSRGTFVREGALWVIDFRGKTVRVKSVKGLEYIARLIARPGEDVHVLELVGEGRGVVESASLGPAIDADAKRAYVARLAALRETFEEASELGHTARADQARAEMEAIEDELSHAMGLGGRARESGSSAERARLAVVKAIRRARDLVARVHPELAQHLQNAIKTGTFCSYRPESDVRLVTPD